MSEHKEITIWDDDGPDGKTNRLVISGAGNLDWYMRVEGEDFSGSRIRSAAFRAATSGVKSSVVTTIVALLASLGRGDREHSLRLAKLIVEDLEREWSYLPGERCPPDKQPTDDEGTSSPSVYFFGVWPYYTFGHSIRNKEGKAIDRLFCNAEFYPPDSPSYEQTEGVFWYSYPEGRTVLTSWDRSADERGNSAASFIVDGLVTAERGLQLARESFPLVFERIERHLGKPVVIGGPIEALP